MNDLRERVAAAYGGEAWRRAHSVEAVVSAGGPGFFLKGRRAFDRVKIVADIRRPHCRIAPINARNEVAVLDGADTRIETSGGSVVAERKDARRLFRNCDTGVPPVDEPVGSRAGRPCHIFWDDLAQAYFAGYASWNYLIFPALLLRDDIRWSQRGDDILDAELPPHLPTHSAKQSFVIDPATHLLRRHDYTAEVFGNWARAGHVILEHKSFNGIPVPVRREARRLLGKDLTLPWPPFIWLRVHDWRLT